MRKIQFRGNSLRFCALSFTAVSALAFAGLAYGQYASDFEDLTASAAGEILTGQDGYYIPDGTDSVDYLAYTYAGNALGLVTNPEGGAQFVAGFGPGSPTFARAQRDFDWLGGGVWEVTYDVNCNYEDLPPGANNLGSFSIQPFPGSAGYIHLYSWEDINDPVAWQALFLTYDAAGNLVAQPGLDPGPEWNNLLLNKWYRFTTVIDFCQNKIIEVGITDIDTQDSVFVDVSNDGYYLEGGEAGGMPIPTGFRFFAGGGVAGNVVAWDNASMTQVSTCSVCPDSGTILAGIKSSGVFGDVCASDDTRWVLQSTTFAAVFSPAPIQVQFDGNFATAGASLTFNMEGHPTLGGGSAFLTVQMWNYTTGSYTSVPFINQPDGTDTLYSLTVDNSSGDYVDTNGDVRALVTCAKTQDGPVRLHIDQAFWD